jgi:2-dehydro-3-deoxyphosphogluconate aldolase/(4S)-4-hydroxy-2-oxoglutarate aldolase
MNMNKIFDRIAQIGIVPVIKIDDAKDAVALAKALSEGGLSVVEITFRTAAAKEAIKLISDKFPEMLLGAGTVLTTEQVDLAMEAGAKFIVSPGLNTKVVNHCIEKGIPIVPGCSNPSDIEAAIELGLEVVKFFPAEASGGIKMIKAIAAPYPNIKFMPTGGINLTNLNNYLSFNKIIACGGSWMASDQLINEGKFDEIKDLTKQAVEQMLGFELAHIGINAGNQEQAENLAETFMSIIGSKRKDGSGSIFAGDVIEIMKSPFKGVNGHIAFKTNFIERAICHLRSKGFEFDEATAKFDLKDNMVAIYLKREIGGFAIHLLQQKHDEK